MPITQSPKQKAHRRKMKLLALATSAKPEKRAPAKDSWWAVPMTREEFSAAAKARDAAMRYDAKWQRPAHLHQVGIL